MSQNDLVAADIVFPHYLDEAYEVLHNPNHRWFYKQGMKNDELILFKLADSAEGTANGERERSKIYCAKADAHGSMSTFGVHGSIGPEGYARKGEYRGQSDCDRLAGSR